MGNVIKLGQRQKAPTLLAVLEEALVILRRRGWKEPSFEDIAAGRTQFFLPEAEKWPISLKNALLLATRNVYGHIQVPIRFQFNYEIPAALDETAGGPHFRWATAAGRTPDDVYDLFARTIARLQEQGPGKKTLLRRRPSGSALPTKADVLKRLSVSPALGELIFDGKVIGTFVNTSGYEYDNGCQVWVRRFTATIPDFHGHEVVQQGCTSTQTKERVAGAMVAILRSLPAEEDMAPAERETRS